MKELCNFFADNTDVEWFAFGYHDDVVSIENEVFSEKSTDFDIITTSQKIMQFNIYKRSLPNTSKSGRLDYFSHSHPNRLTEFILGASSVTYLLTRNIPFSTDMWTKKDQGENIMEFHIRLEQVIKTINIKLIMKLIKDIIIFFAFFLSLTITSFAQDSVIYYSKIPPEKEYLWNDTVKPYLLKITNEKITLLLDSVESYTNNCEFCHLPCYTTIRPMKSYLGYNNWRVTVEQLDNLSGIEYWWKSGTIYGVFYYKEKLYFVINLQATDVEIADKFFSRTPYKKNIYINDETFKKWISSFKFIFTPDRKDRNINSNRDWEEINIHPFDYLELLFKENENDFSARVEQPCVPLNKKDKADEK